MTQDILAISTILTDVEWTFNLKWDILFYHCSFLVVNIILNIMMIKHVNALKLKSEFESHSHKLIKKKRAFDAQKQEKNKDLIFIININEDLEYISDASDDDVDDNEYDK